MFPQIINHIKTSKLFHVLFKLNVVFLLLNMAERLINSTAFLESFMWQIFSGGFLDLLEELENLIYI